MSDEKPKKQKKRSAAKENGGGKEHKRPWQEAMATPEEIQRLQRHNERFESSCTERELVFWYFRPPETEGEGEFMPVGLARETDTHTPDTPVF